jgi:chemotaxis protein MotB
VLFWKGQQLEQQHEQLKQQQKELKAARKRIGEVEKEVKKMLGVRSTLIQQLRRHFAGIKEKVQVDPKTGALRIGEAVLYDFNSNVLKKSGQAVVARVYDKLAGVLFKSGFPYNKHLASISIEGHASREALPGASAARLRRDYLTNLELSQRRAQAVLDHLSRLAAVDQIHLRRYAVAVGYGYSRPRDPANLASPVNRRIEITFRLRDEEALEQMRILLDRMK